MYTTAADKPPTLSSVYRCRLRVREWHRLPHLTFSALPTNIWVIYAGLFVGAKAALAPFKVNRLRSNSLFTLICCIQFTLFPLSIPSVFTSPQSSSIVKKNTLYTLYTTCLVPHGNHTLLSFFLQPQEDTRRSLHTELWKRACFPQEGNEPNILISTLRLMYVFNLKQFNHHETSLRAPKD